MVNLRDKFSGLMGKGRDKEPIFRGESIVCSCESYEETARYVRGEICECVLKDRDFKFIARLKGEEFVLHYPPTL